MENRNTYYEQVVARRKRRAYVINFGIPFDAEKMVYTVKIYRNYKLYEIGEFERYKQAIIAKKMAMSFTDDESFRRWYRYRKIVLEMLEIYCEKYRVAESVIVKAIFDNRLEKLYLNIRDLEEFISEYVDYKCKVSRVRG